jgi:MFS family permease
MSHVAVISATPALTGSDARPRLFNRNFLLLFQAQSVSQFGNQAFSIATAFWTMQATGSATMTGLILMAGVLPVVLLAPFTGTFADARRSRLRIVVVCDFLCGMVLLLLAAGFLLGPQDWRPAMLFAAALTIGTMSAFFDPAVTALLPDLVTRDQIERANAVRQSSRQVIGLSAQGVGGVLYAAAGPIALFVLDGASFLFAAASEMLVRAPERPRPAPPQGRPAAAFLTQTAAGFRYIRSQPGMMAFLMLASLFNACLMPVTVLLPVYATSYLHADVRWYGFLLSAISAGALAGCLLISAVTLTGRARGRLTIGALASLAVSLVLLGQVHSPWLAVTLAFATGVTSGVVNVMVISIVQRQTSDAFRGRVIGLHAMSTRALMPIGMVGGGVIADLTGRNVPLVYGTCGMLALIAVALLAGYRPTRAFLASS